MESSYSLILPLATVTRGALKRNLTRVTVEYTIQAYRETNNSAKILNDAERPGDRSYAVCEKERRRPIFLHTTHPRKLKQPRRRVVNDS